MIQRIQSVWLLLAAVFGALLFVFDVYRADLNVNGIIETVHLTVASHGPSFIVAPLVIILPFIAIFLYKDRKKQRGLVLGGLFATFGFISINFMRINNYRTEHPLATGSYFISSFLPVVILFFLVMALKGIRADDKLVKSLDRLR